MGWFLYDNGLRHERVKSSHSQNHHASILELAFECFPFFVTTLLCGSATLKDSS